MAAITKAIIGEDISGQLKEECSAHLDSLMALADAKAEYFAEKIKTDLLGAGVGTDKTFPISTIQSFIYQTKAYTSDDAKNISNVINESINGFIDGNNKSAVNTLVSGFVNILFGSSVGAEQKILRYCAILEGVSMIRLDFAGWSRSVSASAIKSKCDKVSAFVLYRSIVDMSKVTLNDFISVYQDTVRAENKDIDAAGVIKKCQELYYVFNPSKKPVLGALADSETLSIKEVEFLPTIGYESFDVFTKNVTSL
ncbi:hypothetical protein F909_02638 [Acinetobacter sp. ANC 3929]|uniref:hypothetical protein n=1 Tax=unclassified Acinetobacter TaxID=196816 RepID=UPI0002CF9A0A|nr:MULTISPECIES: hypothetical protein [unclassified Acinetobacter]ENW81347.1 hypothetical protein F909_02638 [Acinetobacter sp. ANC 3929]MCH7354384.1 hypothetical protein [Acinetobacter sp. NIPH 1958]